MSRLPRGYASGQAQPVPGLPRRPPKPPRCRGPAPCHPSRTWQTGTPTTRLPRERCRARCARALRRCPSATGGGVETPTTTPAGGGYNTEQLPGQPPVPLIHCGGAWWSVGVDGPSEALAESMAEEWRWPVDLVTESDSTDQEDAGLLALRPPPEAEGSPCATQEAPGSPRAATGPPLANSTAEAADGTPRCKECGAGMAIATHRYSFSQFWKCNRWPTCAGAQRLRVRSGAEATGPEPAAVPMPGGLWNLIIVDASPEAAAPPCHGPRACGRAPEELREPEPGGLWATVAADAAAAAAAGGAASPVPSAAPIESVGMPAGVVPDLDGGTELTEGHTVSCRARCPPEDGDTRPSSGLMRLGGGRRAGGEDPARPSGSGIGSLLEDEAPRMGGRR